jgi:hypothetical protein
MLFLFWLNGTQLSTESSSDINSDGAQCHPVLRIYSIKYTSNNFHYSVVLYILILFNCTVPYDSDFKIRFISKTIVQPYGTP